MDLWDNISEVFFVAKILDFIIFLQKPELLHDFCGLRFRRC